MAHWLLKTEADAYAIDDLERDGRTGWDGVRNYLARNHMRAMRRGDSCIIYHSNGDPSGAAGVAKVVRTAYPDPTAWDRKDSHYDARSTPERPLWDMVDVAFAERFPAVLALERIKSDDALAGMILVSGKAMRLSVQPLDAAHFKRLVALGRKA